VKNILEQLNDKIDDDIYFDFEGFLYSFFQGNPDYNKIEKIKTVCEDIITTEMTNKIEVDLEGQLILFRNTNIHLSEYIYKALNEKGQPMHIEELYEAVKLKKSDNPKSLEPFRVVLIREKHLFTSFSRTSTYGLVEWDKKRTDLKSGTIRDMTEKYLKQFDTPKHITEIAAYVHQYRPNTPVRSISSNIMVDAMNRFASFKGDYYGLSSKIYTDTNFTDIPTRFINRLVILLKALSRPDYEDFVLLICQKYKLEKNQVTFYLEGKIKEGILRLENNKIILC
jgi:hypothetical protein